MNFIDRFLERSEFLNYEDFKQNYRLKIPKNFNFAYDVVDEYARLQSDKPALVHVDEDENVSKYSFGDIKKLSDKAANVLKTHGIKKGDRVMMMLKERVEVWVTIVALCKIGAVSIPATFQLTPKDIAYRCASAKIKFICFAEDSEVIKHLREAQEKFDEVRDIPAAIVGDDIASRYGDEFIDYRKDINEASDTFVRPTGDESTKNTDIMLTYFSSGTTGMPKMVTHNFVYPLGHITTAKYWQKIEDEGLHLTMADSGWAKFAWGKIYGQWIAGGVMVAFDTGKFDSVKLLRTIDKLKLTTFCAPPTIYKFLIKEDMSSCDFSSLRHFGTAGEPLNPEVVNRFKEATGHTIYEGFGQTETTVMLANFGWDELKLGSTGKPSPLYDIDIVDENDKPCEDGVVGRIVVKNAADHPCGLFVEYAEDQAAMDKAWKNGIYDTGDTAWRDSDGYFWFEGRSDDIIKCSGYRIGPFEVESALMTHPSVLECAVTAAPDPIRGQVVKATIVLARGFTASDDLKKEIQNHVKSTTAPYKYPRIVDFVAELPKTISGKVRRVELRK